jgi:hypothetical protein
MSCAIALALTLLAAPEAAAAATTAPAASAAVAVTPALAREPMYADIVRRAMALNVEAGRLAELTAANKPLPRYEGFKADLAALGALDMQGHLDLKARGTDGDLKCILKGISEDLPKRLAEYETAKTVETRVQALKEMSYLLNDNVEVITSPPGPATPPPAG